MTDALAIEHLSKRFGAAFALRDVSLTVRAGEVHGLLGANGSGKSTLIKILSGFHAPEPGGRIALFGATLPLPVPSARLRGLGLAFVHQHLGLIPSLSVTENLTLGRLAAETDWRIDWGREHRRAGEVFARYDLSLDPEAPVARLSAVEQALLAIVRANEDLRAARGGAGLLVLDEPTPFLPRAGVDQLFRLVRACVATGSSVIFVSHDIDEVREITARATILRDGQVAGTLDTARASHAEFVERIIGRSLSPRPAAARPAASVPGVAVEGLAAPGLGPCDLTVGAGEILGLTGLIGSGYDRVLAHLYGAVRPEAGTLTLPDGSRITLRARTPEAAVAQGTVFLPADRLGAAGVAGLSLTENATLPVLDALRGAFGLDHGKRRVRTAELGTRAAVRPNNPDLALGALSGGNQQKILMAKWLQTRPRLILLDEPTQGVDVGARQHLWDMLGEAAAGGACVMVASTDSDQLAQICHRVLILSRGRIVAELAGDTLTKDSIARHCYMSQTSVT